MDLYMDATDGSMDAMDTCNVYIYIYVVALDGRMCYEGCHGWMLKIMVNL